jgi:hypothetical protein
LLAFLNLPCMAVSGSWYRDQGYLYLSPLPQAEFVAPETEILVRFVSLPAGHLTNLDTFVKAVGDKSGSHAGQTKVASDGRTVIFRPSSAFLASEVVTVELSPACDDPPGKVDPIQYQFFISRPADAASAKQDLSLTSRRPAARSSPATLEAGTSPSNTVRLAVSEPAATAISQARITGTGVSIPSDFPVVTITANSRPSPGYLFITNRGQGNTLYTMMLDNNGDPVWYRRGAGRDFKVQANGMITWATFSGCDKNFDSSRSFSAVDGYTTDDHELQVLEDGGYLLIGNRVQTVDMRRVVDGGQPSATVHENAIQEFTASGELIFQWRGWDYCDPRDADPWMVDLRSNDVTFMHTNSICVDEDGNLVVSHRHLSEATKIDRQTGEVIWRLGGAHNQFTWVNDGLDGFRNQHDVRALGKGHYTVFDNGNGHDPFISRAVEYALDVNTMSATLVWEFRDKPDLSSWYMGNVQRLATGNTLINFGLSGYPKVLEVDPNGEKQFEMNLLPNWDVYRTFRFPWNGKVEVPYLIVEPDYHHINLIFNKFGDPNVAFYRICAGTSPQPTEIVETSPVTLAHVSNLQSGHRYYFRVTAVDGQGHESGYSNEESAMVFFTDPVAPGVNMVANGDFAKAKDGWTWQTAGSASGDWQVENGVAHLTIAPASTQRSDVQLSQARMQLVQAGQYLLEFTAAAKPGRIIEVQLTQDPSGRDYSRLGPIYVPTSTAATPQLRRFSYSFTMQDLSDLNSRLVINAGGPEGHLYLDNISLKRTSQ